MIKPSVFTKINTDKEQLAAIQPVRTSSRERVSKFENRLLNIICIDFVHFWVEKSGS